VHQRRFFRHEADFHAFFPGGGGDAIEQREEFSCAISGSVPVIM
jgi:hypothetical protein